MSLKHGRLLAVLLGTVALCPPLTAQAAGGGRGTWTCKADSLAGYKQDPGVDQASVALEKRVGGHVFQVNFSNAFGTTMGQIARGGFNSDDWYLGSGTEENALYGTPDEVAEGL